MRFRTVSLRLRFLSALIAAFVSIASAQVKVDEKSDQLAALKIELENIRSQRDKVVTKRWEDKQVYAESREQFNQKFDELKDALESKRLEAERLNEEVQILQREVEESKGQLEDEKARFAGLNSLSEQKLSVLSENLNRGIPSHVPERQDKLNQVKQVLIQRKDDPASALQEVISLFKQETQLSREIVLEKGGFLKADRSPGEGHLLRVGLVAYFYKDEKGGQSGMMLQKTGVTQESYEWREDLAPEIAKALAEAWDQLLNKADKVAMIPIDVLQNKITRKAYTLSEQQTWMQKTMALIKGGGVFMWPLLLFPIAALLILLERLLVWRKKSSAGESLYENVVKDINQNPENSKKLCAQKPHDSVVKCLQIINESRDKTREIAEKNVQEIILHEGPQLEKRLATLSVLAAAAPLLGLLGTVSGLINMFQAITLYGNNDPKILAGGISEALITTETGLVIAIPILFAHNFMSNRMDAISMRMEKYSLKALNALWPEG